MTTTKLQVPPYVYMDGGLKPWAEANVHVASESLIRAASVFEGIKGYWDHDGTTFNWLEIRAHFERLRRSARLLHLPFEMSFDAFLAACDQLTAELLEPGRDLWIRPTLLAVEGHWGLDTVTDLVVTGYTLGQERPEPISVGFSSWQRPADRAQPTRIKSSANYQVGRLARIEGRSRGHQDMILSNTAGRVAEGTGSCLLLVHQGVVHTPPAYEGCLESITVNIIEELARALDLPFVRRPIEFSELAIADELFLAGTLGEIIPISRVEDQPMPAVTPILDRLADAFWDTARGAGPGSDVELTPLQIDRARREADVPG